MIFIVFLSLISGSQVVDWNKCDTGLVCDLHRTACFDSSRDYRESGVHPKEAAAAMISLAKRLQKDSSLNGARAILADLPRSKKFWTGLVDCAEEVDPMIVHKLLLATLDFPDEYGVDYLSPQLSMSREWLVASKAMPRWFSKVQDAIHGCVDSDLSRGLRSRECMAPFASELIDSFTLKFPGARISSKGVREDAIKYLSTLSFVRLKYAGVTADNFAEWSRKKCEKLRGCDDSVFRKITFLEPKKVSKLSELCMEYEFDYCFTLIAFMDSLRQVDHWSNHVYPSLLARVIDRGEAEQVDSLLDSIISGREAVARGRFLKVREIFSLFDSSRQRKFDSIVVLRSVLVSEDRHWFPQVEMPPAFALWFYGDSSKSQRQVIDARVPKLLSLTAAEQMACLRDTTSMHCGEIRDFVRETAGWGGAESVKPFKFLIRPMTRKPPGWK